MITKICSAIRCFLSDVLFEKIFGWRNVDEVVSEVKASVAKHNYGSRAHCYARDRHDLVHDISGSDGLFTSVHQFYRCRKCGNAQDTTGNTSQYDSDVLEEKRIIRDGGRYRYIFLTSGWWGLVFCSFALWAVFGSTLFVVSYEFSYLQGLAIGFVPLILFVLGALTL